jgi:ParB family chromosome partitioning protein
MTDNGLEWVDVGDLVPWEGNPRHNQMAVKDIMNSIERFGFSTPLVARRSDLRLIAGHTRLEAAKRLNLEQVPVRLMDDLTDDQCSALALADNKLGELAAWNEHSLIAVLKELEAGGEAVDGLGWSEAEIKKLLTLDEAMVANPAEDEWVGMPDFESESARVRAVTVSFAKEEHVAAFFALVGQSYTEKTKSIWYPEKKRQDLKDLGWDDDD